MCLPEVDLVSTLNGEPRRCIQISHDCQWCEFCSDQRLSRAAFEMGPRAEVTVRSTMRRTNNAGEPASVLLRLHSSARLPSGDTVRISALAHWGILF